MIVSQSGMQLLENAMAWFSSENAPSDPAYGVSFLVNSTQVLKEVIISFVFFHECSQPIFSLQLDFCANLFELRG